MAFWWQKQKLKWCNYKPNNAKERQQNQKLEKEREYSTLQVSEETWPCWQLAFGVLASKTVRWYISAVSSSQFLVLCYGSLRKLFNGTGGKMRPCNWKWREYPSSHQHDPFPVGSAQLRRVDGEEPDWQWMWEQQQRADLSASSNFIIT